MNLRNLLKSSIENLVEPDKPLAILFSGGTDSLCMLWTALDLGHRPVLYHYVVEGHVSGDRRRVKAIADFYSLPLTVATIPLDVENLKWYVRRIINDGIHGKVNIQCMHGHYHLAPLVCETQILNGSGVDGLYGVYRQMAIASRKDPAAFQKMRLKYLDDPNSDAMVYQSKLYNSCGVKSLFPYTCEPIRRLLMSRTWDQMNRPRSKWIICQHYQREFGAFQGLWRPRGSQQIEAGTRALHDKLIITELNTKYRKRVDEIYKDIANASV